MQPHREIRRITMFSRQGGDATPVSSLTGTLVVKPRSACFVIVTGPGFACAGDACAGNACAVKGTPSATTEASSATPSRTTKRSLPH